jgi:tRNA(Ile)-lysidine synthetase-like protein
MCVTCTPAQQVVSEKTVFTVSPQGNLLLRCRQEGDRITLSGGTKSLKRLFIDKKIPAQTRSQIPVLRDETGILAVGGVGADHKRIAKELPAWQFRLIYTEK